MPFVNFLRDASNWHWYLRQACSIWQADITTIDIKKIPRNVIERSRAHQPHVWQMNKIFAFCFSFCTVIQWTAHLFLCQRRRRRNENKCACGQSDAAPSWCGGRFVVSEMYLLFRFVIRSFVHTSYDTLSVVGVTDDDSCCDTMYLNFHLDKQTEK